MWRLHHYLRTILYRFITAYEDVGANVIPMSALSNALPFINTSPNSEWMKRWPSHCSGFITRLLRAKKTLTVFSCEE
jgi:hypothetical protein